jgi:release factor glutamine methyltransferase
VTVAEALRAIEADLAAARVDDARRSAELLLEHVLGVRRADLFSDHERTLTGEEEHALAEVVARRRAREPVQYILGEWDFRRLTLKVDRRALIPRPETEVLVERCLALLEDVPAPRVLDVGVGSGAIALSIADERPDARVTGIDSSADALVLARENASRLAIEVELVERDAAADLPPGPWDLVVSNPPYVPEHEVDSLEPEVREWEPREAIADAGQTRAVACAAAGVLAPGGWLVLETHWDRAPAVASLLEGLGYVDVRRTRDLAGHERVVEGRRS